MYIDIYINIYIYIFIYISIYTHDIAPTGSAPCWCWPTCILTKASTHVLRREQMGSGARCVVVIGSSRVARAFEIINIAKRT